MSCNNCGENQTGGIYSKCPDGSQPLYQYLLFDLAVSNTVPVGTIGPYDHATALLELQKFLNPPITPVTPVTYNVIQVLFCGHDEISRSNSFPLSCGGGGTGLNCLPPPTCPLAQWNTKTCECCEGGRVFCVLTGECVSLPPGCDIEEYNPLTCQCCPSGYIYCRATGTCELPQNCGGSGCPPGFVYCAATGTCVPIPEGCPPLQYNQSTCQCCPPNSVYCIASQTCIPREDIPCLLSQWNQVKCECCPPGSVYCGTTGTCIPIPGNCTIVTWNPVDCECCPYGFVFCEATGTCIPIPEGCTVVQYNPIDCECCPEGQVFCLLTQACVPLPVGCTIEQWNPTTCLCCPPGTVFDYNTGTCRTVCNPASYAPVTLDWELLPNGGGIQINGVEGAGGQQATAFTVVITAESGQGVPPVVIQFPITNPNDPPVTLPISIPLLSGDYSFVVSDIKFGDCNYTNEVSGDIEGVTAFRCCDQIVGVGGGNEIRFFETDIQIPLDAVAPYNTFIDIYTIVMVDRVSAYLWDGSDWVEVAQSPFIGTTALPTNEYPALAFAQGAENGYWRNSLNRGSLTLPFRYAADSGNPAGKIYPESDFGFAGSNNYLTPANRAQFGGTAPANFPFSGINSGKGRLFFQLPDTANPGDTVTVRFRIEGGKDGTVWYAVPGCLIDQNCANCGETVPIPDECCPFALVKELGAELNQAAGSVISLTLPDDLVVVNGVAPYTVSVTFSPGAAAGLSYDPVTKEISGTLIPGPLNILLQITDAQGCTVTQIVNLVIACPNIDLRAGGGQLNQTFAINDVVSSSAAVVFSGGTAPFSFSIVSGALPNGLSIAPDVGNPAIAIISGTVAVPIGLYTFVIRATDSNGCTSDLVDIFAWTITN